jgi:two-component system phosphate regulon sensor histidine kinase PhoR
LFKPWTAEFWRFAAITGTGAFLGYLLGYLVAGLLVALLVYFIWHIRNLFRLYQWLLSGNLYNPPEADGIWGDVYNQIYHMQQRHRDRKKKLTEILERYQESTAAMPDATVILTNTGEIEWFNKAAAQLLGLRGGDIGQRLVNLVRNPGFANYIKAKNYRDPLVIAAPVHSDIQLSFRIVPYGNHQYLVIARDVTRLVRLEHIRRDFVANVSHELKTPLTVISGFVETMTDSRDECSQRWSRPLGHIQQQVRRMQHIVNDLLMLTRLESMDGKPDMLPVRVSAMLAAIREDALLLSGERHHEIMLQADPDLMISGVEKDLHSAFTNLIFNSVVHTPDGTRVTVRWYRDDQGAHLSVEDNGQGIAPQYISRLTERFYRVDKGRSRDRGGTGLGLAIVKHVLQEHGARLTITSEVDAGSCFSCDFSGDAIVTKP